MGRTTGIEWTDHTFNIVWGCAKVSPGCANCYAIGESRRRGFDVWGTERQGASRRIFGDAHWNEPLRWNRDATRDGVRRRVFCSSMADVCDEHPMTRSQIPRLFATIRETPSLDWQLLTKRPESWRDVLPDDWGEGYENVWLGTSVESQPYADERVPLLLATRARTHFLSVEPLLGPVSLRKFAPFIAFLGAAGIECPHGYDACPICDKGVDWVIVGGESGAGARPMREAWARTLRDECRTAHVPFFFKQWGQHDATGKRRASKHDAGRALDGVEYSQMPLSSLAAGAP